MVFVMVGREGEDERLVIGCADGSVSFFAASGSVIGHHVSLGSPITALAPFSSGTVRSPARQFKLALLQNNLVLLAMQAVSMARPELECTLCLIKRRA